MDKTKIGVIAATAILGLGALGGAAVKASATSNPVKSAAPPATAAVNATAEAPEADAGMPDTDNVQQGDHSGPDTPGVDKAEAASGKADTDNVQLEEGDQTTPDVAGASGD
jgi:hypothetical protein